VIVATILVLNAHVSDHFVAYSMATKMYRLLSNFVAGLIGLIKSNPHFKNGSSGKVITNSAKFCVNRLPIL
jgi:hypothetical protein